MISWMKDLHLLDNDGILDKLFQKYQELIEINYYLPYHSNKKQEYKNLTEKVNFMIQRQFIQNIQIELILKIKYRIYKQEYIVNIKHRLRNLIIYQKLNQEIQKFIERKNLEVVSTLGIFINMMFYLHKNCQVIYL